MASKGRNMGLTMLEDFVTEAIHNPSIRLATPNKQGRSEGITMLEDVICDFGIPPQSPESKDTKHQDDTPQKDLTEDQDKNEPPT